MLFKMVGSLEGNCSKHIHQAASYKKAGNAAKLTRFDWVRFDPSWSSLSSNTTLVANNLNQPEYFDARKFNGVY